MEGRIQALVSMILIVTLCALDVAFVVSVIGKSDLMPPQAACRSKSHRYSSPLNSIHLLAPPSLSRRESRENLLQIAGDEFHEKLQRYN
ncbi:hypothetical protein F2Q70_00004892 [Brassica cretica]|uniref:Uncharacterized protein n=1 Tax=Brassica cretica TaxID=69181 RepID=A0A8S9IX10_BRACR|nr:hypothetical protein F2Q70_00004892 [Brassica cretica]